jgi:hypothetical protein
MFPRLSLTGLGLLASTVVSFAQWVAFNDHAPGTGTHANTTRYHAFTNGNPNSGVLRNSNSGTNLPVVLTISVSAGVVGQSSAANPAAGTPLANVFGGFVDFQGSPLTSIEVSGAAVVTYTFSNLKTNALYRFHGSSVRGAVRGRNWGRGVKSMSLTPALALAGVRERRKYCVRNYLVSGVAGFSAAGFSPVVAGAAAGVELAAPLLMMSSTTALRRRAVSWSPCT